MSVTDGQSVNAAVTNAAFMSRTTDTSTTGVVDLNNTSDGDSGSQITNAQQAINETFDAVGMTGIDDAGRKTYSSNNVVTDGDNHKVAIGKIDTNIITRVSKITSTDTAIAKYSGTGGDLADSGVLIDGSNNVTGINNLTVTGDLTVNGATTTISTATLDVEDTNITINDGGNDASSEGAGITIERTGTDGSLVYEDALTSKFKIGALASEVEVATVSGAQAITNKDIDGGTASNTSRLTIPQDTKANLDGLTRKEGTIVYANDSDKIFIDDGTTLNEVSGGGAGGGGINFLEGDNFTVDDSIGDWVAYADAAAVSPVDGTGGAPTSTVAITTTGSEILRGTGSGELAKDAANRQGEGASVDFTIGNGYQASQLTINFKYSASANFAYNGGTAGDESDIMVWIYDVTNATLIQPTPYGLDGSGEFVAQFQSAPDSVSYRLIFHIATTNASAWDFFFDDIQVGPSAIAKGAPVTEWDSQPWTPTGSWTTNTTYTGKWRRVGDTAEFDVQVSTSGAPTAANLTVNLPSGLVTNTTKLSAPVADNPIVGFGNILDTGVAMWVATVRASGTGAVDVVYHLEQNETSNETILTPVSHVAPHTMAAGDSVQLKFSVPILGWSSNVQMSDDADTRVVSMVAYKNGGSITAATTIASWTDVNKDTHGGFNSSTGIYTIQVSGDYWVDYSAGTTGTANNLHSVYVNGTQTLRSDGYAANGVRHVSGLLEGLQAGDTIDVRPTANDTLASVDFNRLSIFRLSGPSAIAASEKVAALYEDNGGQALTANVTDITFSTKTSDTHGAWNGSIFTANRSGYYSTKGMMAITASTDIGLQEYINGSAGNRIDTQFGTAATVHAFATEVFLNAGDTFSIRSTSSVTLSSSTVVHWIAITSQGGV